MLRYLPLGRTAGEISNACWNNSAVSPKLNPALRAARLASRTTSLEANRVLIQSRIGSIGRANIHDSTPRAKKFLERSASRGLAPVSLAASSVIEVIGTSYTVKLSREPSSRGLTA